MLRKQILSFLLGATLTISAAVFAQTNGVTIFKPAAPAKTLVVSYNAGHKVKKEIESQLAQGWIVKAMTMGTYEMIVVFEKY